MLVVFFAPVRPFFMETSSMPEPTLSGFPDSAPSASPATGVATVVVKRIQKKPLPVVTSQETPEQASIGDPEP